MNFFGTLTRQFVVISIILLLFLAIDTYSDFVFTHNMKGKAAGIDLAGQFKSKPFEIAWMLERLVERDVERLDEKKRTDFVNELRSILDNYDTTARYLKEGNKKLDLKPLISPEILALFNAVTDKWQGEMKPLVVKIIELPSTVSESDARDLLRLYDSKIYQYNAHVDRLVSFLLANYEEDIRKFDIFRLYVLGIFCAATIITIMYIRQNIVKPLRSFAHAAHEIRKGNFDVCIEVTNQDEMGQFAERFNEMTARLKDAFHEIRQRSDNVLALNNASNAIVGFTDELPLYKAICENARALFDFRMVWLGLLHEGNYSVAPVAYAGFEEGCLNNSTITWDDSPTGRGAIGTAIRLNIPQIINDIKNDPIFTPWLSDAGKKEYGSMLSVPLICGGTAVIGVLNFYSDKLGYFTPDKVELCQVYANQAAIAIENLTLLTDLDAKVKSRTRELEDAKLLAESANMAKSAFLANMSHDLRTPLNAIIGFSEAMSQGIYGEIRADHKEYLEYIYQSGLKLLKLINEVLDLSKMETGGIELCYGEYNISDIMNNALYIFREKAKKHRIDISVTVAEDARLLTVDESKIKQVFVNLLTDAINATPDKGTILIETARVSCSPADISGNQEASATADRLPLLPERDCIKVAITDSRPAITDTERVRFFDPYKQFDTTIERKQDNVGLLLSKRYVELHGGRIWAEGVPAESPDDGLSAGNRFIFVLPQRP
ncbi:MAG: GAF domain-containing protein [Nitrospirae bacterium]|nr:GAF domain-containing protein [Nitrospirota bacterium]